MFIAATEAVSARTVNRCNPRVQNDSVYMDLFSAFIQRCQFTSEFVSVDKDLFDLLHSSRLCYDLAIAIGALEASRRSSCSQLYAPGKTRAMAFMCYGNALKALQEKLAKAGAAYCEDVLWSTFLFGLFEVSNTCATAEDLMAETSI
jgi:hypothetical protein